MGLGVLVWQKFLRHDFDRTVRTDPERGPFTVPEANGPSHGQVTARRLYPEIAAGGYSRHDGFVDFFLRVGSLLTPESTVLDFGAGRGAWTEGELAPLQRELRNPEETRRPGGRRRRRSRRSAERLQSRKHTRSHHGPLPFDDETFDLVLADHVLEHVSHADAPAVATELGRVLKPDGWIAARTPNKWGLIAVAARLVPTACTLPSSDVFSPAVPPKTSSPPDTP